VNSEAAAVETPRLIMVVRLGGALQMRGMIEALCDPAP
jgi:hypothetical protein